MNNKNLPGINLATIKTIDNLYKKGYKTSKQIRSYFNDPGNIELNNFINIRLTHLKNL